MRAMLIVPSWQPSEVMPNMSASSGKVCKSKYLKKQQLFHKETF